MACHARRSCCLSVVGAFDKRPISSSLLEEALLLMIDVSDRPVRAGAPFLLEVEVPQCFYVPFAAFFWCVKRRGGGRFITQDFAPTEICCMCGRAHYFRLPWALKKIVQRVSLSSSFPLFPCTKTRKSKKSEFYYDLE